MDDPLKIEVTHEPGLAIVTLIGEARLQVKPLEIELNRLCAAHPSVVILEMTGLSLVSSLGMGLLVSLRNTLRRSQGRLLAVGIQPMVLDSFKRARLEDLFETFDSMDAARVSIAPKA